MTTFEAIIAMAAIAGVCVLWLLVKAVESASKLIADRLGAQNQELDRIGTKLDNLWSPIKGINTVLWEKSGINPDLD